MTKVTVFSMFILISYILKGVKETFKTNWFVLDQYFIQFNDHIFHGHSYIGKFTLKSLNLLALVIIVYSYKKSHIFLTEY